MPQMPPQTPRQMPRLTPPLTLPLPWTDRAGRFSALKAAVLALTLVPAALLAARAIDGRLGPRPITEAIHVTGDWSVYFLLGALLIAPLRQIADLPRLLQVRRMLGLSALGYALLHLLLYAADQNFMIGRIVSEIVARFYLAVGLVALLGLIALGATSTDGAIRRMGAAWHRLHGLVHLLTALALFHYFLQSKIDVTLPVLVTGFFLILAGWRLLRRRRLQTAPIALLLLAPAAALATAGVEWAWYRFATNLPAERILAANLSFDPMVRPAWWVLAAGLLVAAIALVRAPRRDARRRAEPARG